MASKEALLKKLTAKPIPRNFTMRELDQLMSKCGCYEISGGRGSSVKYINPKARRSLIFDKPHPGNELYPYQIKKAIDFLEYLGELRRDSGENVD